MIVNARTDYACLAMLELASAYESGELVQIRRIAERHGIPSRFLVQILLQLKQASLVRSTRGSCGGYQLNRSPEEITLADILEAVDSLPRRVASELPGSTPSQRVLQGTWQQLGEQLLDRLQDIRLSQLEQEVRDQSAGMYYI